VWHEINKFAFIFLFLAYEATFNVLFSSPFSNMKKIVKLILWETRFCVSLWKKSGSRENLDASRKVDFVLLKSLHATKLHLP
jgi:hypothetical protein